MDIRKFIDAAYQRDVEMQKIFIANMEEEDHDTITMKAIKWAITTDRPLYDVFFDFDDVSPGLAAMSQFANESLGMEMEGHFCFARDLAAEGRPVIAFAHPSTIKHLDPELSAYVNVKTFEDFVAAYEGYEARNTLEAAEAEADAMRM